ncbi:DUF6364 family protein [Methanobrevibacter curvatus]|uniref:Ribbon-helix-helix protein CopG domain-containing protein n=1 Tax=Methanobrevibacter curvatus TaxID=49547 RepID=A0A166AFM2_9EURY|nr:DUF6364 family protein [Methanobrevibacter curvatus]KZX11969.1 hypothetical protein MBCUR_12340 [Methanobrevibacter curvatus]
MQNKNRTTISLEPKIMETIKQIAINKGTTQTKIINNYLKQCIEKEPEKNKIKINVITEGDTNIDISDFIGSIKTDKPFNAIKFQNQVRKGE